MALGEEMEPPSLDACGLERGQRKEGSGFIGFWAEIEKVIWTSVGYSFTEVISPPVDPITSGFLLELFALSGLRLHGRGPGRKGLRGNRKTQTSPRHHPNAFGALHRDLATLFEEVFQTGGSKPSQDAPSPISGQGRD